MIQIKTFYAFNDLRNYSYLVYDDSSGAAWAIDPYDSAPFVEYIKRNSLSLKGILNTHQHFDHVRGNQGLLAAFNCGVKTLNETEKIVFAEGVEVKSLNTPGHTLDHQVFILNRMNAAPALFAGDTLFNSGVGNCKNGGDVNLLFDTTKRILEMLPKETILYPGHDYAEKNLSFAQKLEPENQIIGNFQKEVGEFLPQERRPRSLAEERLVNPFFRLNSEELRSHLRAVRGSEREVFIELRKLRDSW